MNWLRELMQCRQHVFSFVAVDAFRRLNRSGQTISVQDFLAAAADILVSRQISSADRATILVGLAYELSNGSIAVVSAIIGPILHDADSEGEDLVEVEATLATYGLRRSTRGGDRKQPGDEAVLAPRRAETVETVRFLDGRMSGAGAGVVIMVALGEEFDAFEAVCRGTEIQLGVPASRKYRNLFRGTDDVVLVCVGDSGTTETALAAQWAIERWTPGLLILAGIAGGFAEALPDFSLGDLVVPPQIVGYELAKVTETEVKRRLRVMLVGAQPLNLALSLVGDDAWKARIHVPDPVNPDRQPRIHIGPLASGDKVVGDGVMVGELRSLWPGSIATEMEAAGLALAAFQARDSPQILICKSACDWADSHKGDLYHSRACAVSAAFAVEVADRWSQMMGNQRSVVARRPIRVDGLVKNAFWERIGDLDLERLANVLGIPKREVRTWPSGYGGARLFEWIEERGRADDLPAGLMEIERHDLSVLFYEENNEVLRALARSETRSDR